MERQRLKKILKRIFKILLAIGIFVLISTTNGKQRTTSWAEDVVTSVVLLPQRVVDYIKYISNTDSAFTKDIDSLKNENKELKTKVDELEKKLSDYDLVLQENASHRALEEATNTYKDYEVVIAEVISNTQNNWDDLYIINKGKEQGIKPNMAVITIDGLVGYISEVGANTSKVISILDASSSFSALQSETREQVIIKGDLNLKNDNKIKAVEIPLRVEFESGDVFETSGIGGIYPKGIKIGRATQFINKANPLENEVEIETFVNFNKLERVAVVVSEE